MKIKNMITNPRRILSIGNRMADISIKRDIEDKSTKTFSFAGLDISSVHGSGKIDKNAKIILEISSDVDSQRFELGTYGSPKKITDQLIELDGKNFNYKYHLFIVEGNAIKASNEIFRVQDVTKTNSKFRGFLTIEPAGLGEIAWRVYPVDGDSEPILQVNDDPDIDIFSKLHSGVDNTYRSLIVPNAIEQCLNAYLKNPIAGSGDAWQNHWKLFFGKLNIESPDNLSSDEERQDWLEHTMDKISSELKLLTILKETKHGNG